MNTLIFFTSDRSKDSGRGPGYVLVFLSFLFSFLFFLPGLAVLSQAGTERMQTRALAWLAHRQFTRALPRTGRPSNELTLSFSLSPYSPLFFFFCFPIPLSCSSWSKSCVSCFCCSVFPLKTPDALYRILCYPKQF